MSGLKSRHGAAEPSLVGYRLQRPLPPWTYLYLVFVVVRECGFNLSRSSDHISATFSTDLISTTSYKSSTVIRGSSLRMGVSLDVFRYTS